MDTSNPSHPMGKRAGYRKPPPAEKEAHFLSLAAKDDAKPFGSLRGGETVLNERGKALASCWRELALLRPGLEPDILVIGPRRLRGLLFLPASATDGSVTLSEAIRLFKVLSSLRLSQVGKAAAGPRKPEAAATAVRKGPSALWKKGYLDKPVSGSEELAELRKSWEGRQAP